MSTPRPSISIAAAELPKIAYGRGSRLWDTSGKSYLDGSGGPAVYCLGHAHPEVNAALVRQLEQVAHGYRYTFTSDPLEQLTALVSEACGGNLKHMIFVSGGSEAVESALKLALQYQTAVGQPSRRHFIARRRSWHGNTLGAMSVSGFEERRAPFEGALLDTTLLSPVNAYRPMAGASAETVAEAGAAELEAAIRARGEERVAAFIFEPIVGAAGGAVPAPPGYARRIREVCDRYGVLMIADEVMCGSGRSGNWRTLEHDGVEPDIMTVAKGLGGGYVPLGAAIYTSRIHEALSAAHGGPLTGHTFTGHTLACAAGVAVQSIVKRDGLVERVRTAGERFQNSLRGALGNLEPVGDVRGRGFFVGVEFVADRATKEPFLAEHQLYLRVRRNALERGLICYPSGGNVDGVRGDTAILAPPYNATDAELQEIVDLFTLAVRDSLAEVGAL
ncbi:MAG: aspartate aminotransferase family protein [Meiothermus sp.]|nr:aspartate aminotransferase family protein [Meiothermus sp.]